MRNPSRLWDVVVNHIASSPLYAKRQATPSGASSHPAQPGLGQDPSKSFSGLETLEPRLLFSADAGLITHWTFDEGVGTTVIDVAPQGTTPDTGTLAGNAGWSTEGLNGSLDLSAGGYVAVANSPDMNTAHMDQRTIALAFKADSTSGRQVLFEEGGKTSGMGIYLDEGNLYVGAWSRSWEVFLSTSTSVTAGEWHHVALTLDSTADEMVGYLDGVAFDSGEGRRVPAHGGAVGVGQIRSGMRFHSGSTSGAAQFVGLLDELRIYDCPLTAAEVSQLALNFTTPPDNTAPVAVDDVLVTDEDTQKTINPLGNDTDPDSDPLSVVGVTPGANGAVTFTATSVTYTPDANFFGADSFTYTVSDGNGGTDVGTVNVTVNEVSEPNTDPIAVSDVLVTNEDTPAAIDPRANDSDPEGDPLSVVGVTQGANGTVAFTATSVTYTPDANFFGADSFTYTVSDGNGGTDVGTVNVTVNEAQASGDPKLVSDVATIDSGEWTTIDLDQAYDSMVVVATVVLPDTNQPPLVTRIDNASGSSFDLLLQRVDGQLGTVSGVQVHYMVIEEGVYTAAEHGLNAEAAKVISTITNENNEWNNGQAASYQNSYTAPVVVGQVMSYNDTGFSTFWARGSSRFDAPDSANLSVGKHVGEDPDNTRNDETLGYVVFESGTGTFGGVLLNAGLTSDTITHNAITSPINGLSNPSSAVLSPAGMDGGDGVFAVLRGATPVTAAQLTMSVDEDQFNDVERFHTNEQVAFVVFESEAPTNTAPVVDSPIADVAVNEDALQTQINLAGVFTDAEGDEITVSVTGNTNSGLVSTSLIGTVLTLTYTTNASGTAQITVRGTDSEGLWAQDTFAVNVTAVNDQPVVDSPIADVADQKNDPDRVLDLSGVFTDIEDPAITDLSVTGNTNSGLVSTSLSGTVLTLTYADNVFGTAEITVTGTDSGGLSVQDTFVVEVAHPFTYTGVNLAGAEFGKAFLPGTYDIHYTYPTEEEIDYFIDKGMNTFRLPFRWERMQRELGEALHAEEFARLDAVVSYATSQGATVIIDPHNHALYHDDHIGSEAVTHADFADLWSRLATPYAGNDQVIFNLMNEPVGKNGAKDPNWSTEQWLEAANAAIAAIRDDNGADADNLIFVPGNHWTTPEHWASDFYNGGSNAEVMLGVVDPDDNFVFEVHQYLWESGPFDPLNTPDTIQSETIGRERIEEFTQWLYDNDYQAFLGETAAPNALIGDGPEQIGDEVLNDMFDYMEDNSDVWLGFTYWAAGPRWPDAYRFSLEPIDLGGPNQQDQAAMAVVQPRLNPTLAEVSLPEANMSMEAQADAAMLNFVYAQFQSSLSTPTDGEEDEAETPLIIIDPFTPFETADSA